MNPDRDLLRRSAYTWDEFCGAVLKWNERFPDVSIFTETNEDHNLETMAALLGNANHESAQFKECGEKIQPCSSPPEDICSAGAADWYVDSAWGERCFQVPVATARGFSTDDSLPANACNTVPTCTDWAGRENQGPNCWYGRGALQITWNCNYAKMDRLVSELGIPDIDLCENPDSLCTSKEGFFATAIAFWMSVVHPVYSQDFSIDTAMNCIKFDCRGPWDLIGNGPWDGPGHQDRRYWYETYKAMLRGEPHDAPLPPSFAPTPHPTSPTPSGLDCRADDAPCANNPNVPPGEYWCNGGGSCRESTFSQSVVSCTGAHSCSQTIFQQQSSVQCSSVSSCFYAHFTQGSKVECSQYDACYYAKFDGAETIASCTENSRACSNARFTNGACCTGPYCPQNAPLC